jgi:hypothetical protein
LPGHPPLSLAGEDIRPRLVITIPQFFYLHKSFVLRWSLWINLANLFSHLW